MRRAALVAAVLAPVGYLAGYRPWQLRWGATRAEGAARMPGDELIRGRRWRATRAVEIAAGAESVWPWLAQMGAGRAGWYSYDLVDNGGTPSAREIRPELQTLRVGDRMRFTAGSEDAFTVRRVDPGRCLVLASRVPAGVVVATFVIHPLGEQRSRLVHRVQFSIRPHPAALGWAALMDAGDFVMARRSLLGIRDRAEQLTAGG